MPDDFIRRTVRAVIESFPIEKKKKTDLLQMEERLRKI